MDGRGVLYIVWGRVDRSLLDRSMASLASHHPDLPVHVAELPPDSTLLDKARMADVSPFEETLFLDADTVVLGDMAFGFEKARQFGLAVSICECPWARRYTGLSGDTVEYNTGVVFFTGRARPVFDAWKKAVREVDSSLVFVSGGEYKKMPLNDQAGFARAIEETQFLPFVLPYNWNFRPKWHLSWFGPIKVWHDYAAVPPPILQHNERQSRPESVVTMSAFRG